MTTPNREIVRKAVEWLRARAEVQGILQNQTATDNRGEVSVSPRAFTILDAETENRHPGSLFASARGDVCEVYLPCSAIEALSAGEILTYNEASRQYHLSPKGWAAILDTNKLGEMLSAFLGEPHVVADLLATCIEIEEKEQTEPPLRIVES